MGFCCSTVHESSIELKDLPAPKVNSKDFIAVWEAKLPFTRMSMKSYMHHLDKAYQISGADGEVTLAALRTVFATPTWSSALEQTETGSNAFIIYLQGVCETNEESSFSYKKLVMLGLMYC